MIFVINAYNLKIAGGLNVGFNFLNQLHNYSEDKFYVFVPQNCGYEKFERENVIIINVPEIFQNYLLRWYIDYFWLIKKIKRIDPDVLFSMGNFAIPTKNYPQGLLFHYPHLIYKDSIKLNLRLYEKIALIFQYFTFKNRLKYVDVLFPQTKVAGDRVKKYYTYDKKTVPIPNAYTKLEESNVVFSSNSINKNDDFKYLLVLTKYYPHKNIEILVETAKQIKANGDKVKILITISKEQYPNVGDLLNEIEKANVSDVMINIGPVNIFEIPSLYRSVDGLLLPTVLESFSATYVDAMYFEVPIFTSNLDFAQEICGDVAFYFDPHNSNDIYSTIVNNLFDENKIKEKIALGKIRISQFPDWTKVAFEYINQLKLLKWKK